MIQPAGTETSERMNVSILTSALTPVLSASMPTRRLLIVVATCALHDGSPNHDAARAVLLVEASEPHQRLEHLERL